MKIGFIGLGKMGINMSKRLLHSHEIVCFDKNKDALKQAKENGAIIASSLKDVVEQLKEPKIIWLMLPSGEITNKTIEELSKYLKKDDIIIDGGNSFYKESILQAEKLKKLGIRFLDIGTSGGIWGLKEGYCLMVGGEKKAYMEIEPLLKTLSVKDGYAYMGKSGSGHFVKMIHNGIEYGLMQAYAEGFEILKEKKEFDLDLNSISKLWNHSSVVRSWLLELLEDVFEKNQSLENIKGYVEDSGEGRWSVKEAIDLNVSAPVMSLSLIERFTSRKPNAFRSKILAALRDEFGGHGVKKDV